MARLGSVALLLVCVVTGVLAGCGGEEVVSPTPETVVGTVAQPAAPELPEGDAEAGKDVFSAAGCGGCHTLADAGTNGNIGPNLDESQPDLELAITRVTNGAGAMPAFRDQLSEQQIADVSAYVVESTSG